MYQLQLEFQRNDLLGYIIVLLYAHIILKFKQTMQYMQFKII